MRLYHHPLSGHAHRAALFLSLADLPHELIEVDLSGREHKSPEFLSRNVFGQVPVLEDDGEFVPDSNAILVYLATKHGLRDWYPTDDPRALAEIQRWLSVAAGQLASGPAAARLVTVFGAPLDADALIARSHALFEVVEAVLSERDWLAGTSHPTIADVAVYSYTVNAPEGGVDLARYPHILGLLERIEALPGFTPFETTHVGLRRA